MSPVHTLPLPDPQARPVATPPGHDAAAEEWNDSLSGDYLWTNSNLGEAVPDVMTPCTWSLARMKLADVEPMAFVTPYPPFGNIGGRLYMNLSVEASLAAAFGIKPRRFIGLIAEVFGRLPEDLEIPLVRLSRGSLLRALLPVAFRASSRMRSNRQELPGFVAASPARCAELQARIRETSGSAGLVALWRHGVAPLFHESLRMLEAAAKEDTGSVLTIRRDLQKWVGEDDANALLTGLSADSGQVASLGPLLALTQLAKGEIDRETFARQFGHRGPHEAEVSAPRPAEDPDWIDRQLAGLGQAKVDAITLLARQETARQAAWDRLRQRDPRREASLRRRINRWAAMIRHREAARSEEVRASGVVRSFVLRAGALTGQGEDIFLLSLDEILALLEGDQASLAHIPARRAAYERYCALPPYPVLIRGRFDPFRWAADPQRRSDVLDARAAARAPSSSTITGFPGAAGVVEGLARVIATVEDGDQLQAGEILVTTVTNVGWTPLFPRAAAIVTDVGAPLSHAAIVARELGIPAVVGCRDATMRLHSGDRVRVDGSQGTVEIL